MKKTLIAMLMLTALAATLAAQEERVLLPGHPCPHPVKISIVGESKPPTPDPADFGGTLYPLVAGSQWNQTAVNKQFGTTFHFPAPPKECCLMTRGVLVVTLKALQGGGVNSATSWNDDIVVSRGAHIIYNKRIWPQGSAVATGATTVHTITLGPGDLATGVLSLRVEDDTAVTSAHLTLEGCCLK